MGQAFEETRDLQKEMRQEDLKLKEEKKNAKLEKYGTDKTSLAARFPHSLPPRSRFPILSLARAFSRVLSCSLSFSLRSQGAQATDEGADQDGDPEQADGGRGEGGRGGGRSEDGRKGGGGGGEGGHARQAGSEPEGEEETGAEC
eukprot:3797863-Rhodomonas_salina.1